MLTSDGAGAAVAESNLTFDGSTLYVNGNVTVDNANTVTLARGSILEGYDVIPDIIFSYDGQTKTTMWLGPNKVLVTPTIRGGITELIDQGTLDSDYVSAGGAQGTILTRSTAGEAFSVGQLLFLSSSGLWHIADADSAATAVSLLGVAMRASTGLNDLTSVLLEGHYNTTTYHDQISIPTTIGDPLYISTNPGYVTQIAPTGTGDIVRLIGHNIYGQSGRGNTAVIRFKPDNTWIEI